MSKFNQLIWTFCVVSSVLALYYYFPYFTVSAVLLALVIYLYVDYENHQPTSHRRWNLGLVLNLHAGSISAFWTSCRDVVINFARRLSVYRTSNSTLSRPIMPSVNSYTVRSGPSARPLSGYYATPNLNRDENKLSPRLRNRSRPVQSPGLDGFNALSPIRRESSCTPEDFTRLSINEFDSPHWTGLPGPSHNYISNTSYNTRPAMHPSRSPRVIEKASTTSSASKNIQSFAGPLLASTRYNLSSESALFADATSPGLSSRVTRYSRDSANRSQSATHQSQYSGLGQFPIVHLGKTSRLPVLSSRNSQKLARTQPVRLRMAPPEPEDRRLYILSDRSHALSDASFATPPHSAAPRSVLDTLNDMSRKRLHARGRDTDEDDDDEGEGTKKVRREAAAVEAATQKRTREESPVDEDQRKKRTRSNEILSSLSSSRHIAVKRKTSVDTSGGSSAGTMPADKMLKKSVPSPTPAVAAPPTSRADQPPATAAVAVQVTPKSFVPSPMSIAVSPAESTGLESLAYVKPQKEDTREWLRRGFMPASSSVALKNIQSKRDEDTKNRLKTMMSVIGGDAMPIGQTATTTAVAPSLSSLTTTSTTSASLPLPGPNLKTPFTLSFPDKHVHFAETLTQVKTFVVPTPDSASSAGSTPSSPAVSSATATAPPVALSFGLAASAPKTSTVAETGATPAVSAAPEIKGGEGFKMPVLGGSFALPTFGSARPTSSATVAPSTGFAVSATAAIPTAGGFSLAVPTTSTSFAPSVPPTIASPPTSSFGKPSAPSATAGAITFGAPASSPSTFGQLGAATTLPVMSSGFGKSVPSPVAAYGQVTTSAPATTMTAPTSFGQTAMTFGGAVTSAGMFGQTTSLATVPLKTTFGSTVETSAMGAPPAFGTPYATAAPSREGGFGALAAAKTDPPKLFGFGATTAPTQAQLPAFGAQTAAPSQTGFGGFQQSQVPSMFGAKAGVAPVLASAGGFSFPGGSVASPAQSVSTTTPAGAPPSYSTAVVTSSFQFNAPVATAPSTSSAASSGFGMPSVSKPTAAVFGASAGGPSTNGPSTTSGAFSFGAAAAASKPFAFGESPAGMRGVPSLFGSTASNVAAVSTVQSQSSGVGHQGLFSSQSQQQQGGGVNASNLTTVPIQQKPTSGMFSFGGAASSGATAQPSSQPQVGPFAFGSTSSPKPGGFSFGASAASQPQPASAGGGFSFGSAASSQPTPAFGQTSGQQSFGQVSQAASAFGQAAPAFGQSSQQPLPAFGQITQSSPAFGQSAQAVPSFGQSAQPAPAFGQTAQPAPSFGQQQAAPATGGFQFGAAPAGTGGFNFSGSTPTPPFGAGMPANMFQMGGATPPAPGMFSIGTGTTAPRGRPGPRSRRR